MTKNRLFFGCMLVAALGMQCGDSSPLEPDGPGANEVWIQNSRFNPQSLTISRGTTVTWINKDSETRDVQSGSPMAPTNDFVSPNLDANDTFSHRFSNAGVFNYYSIITQATGIIVVEAN